MQLDGPVLERLPGREVPLSPRRPMVAGIDGESTAPDDTVVTRLLPQRHRRTVGPWCFVDHYGPDPVSSSVGMQVAPHPHTGLQTVSWLLEGHVRHRDTVGSDELVRPGVLGLMTAGRGIAHSERSPEQRPPLLHGVQLWVALPHAARDTTPGFERHDVLPVRTLAGGGFRVLMGQLDGARSPATTYSRLVGAEVWIEAGAQLDLRLEPAYEHAVVVVDGRLLVGEDPAPVARGVLAYLGTGRDVLRLNSAPAGRGARLLLVGGEPFEERLVMWWNFIGRSQSDIEVFHKAWNDPDRAVETFGTVAGDAGARMLAPGLPAVALKPRGRTG